MRTQPRSNRSRLLAGLVVLVVIAGVTVGIVALTTHQSTRERVEHAIGSHPNVTRGHAPVKGVSCRGTGKDQWTCKVSYSDGGAARCEASTRTGTINFACFVRNAAGS